jgi:hypothetical protein
MVVRDRRRRGEVALVGSATKLGSSCGILMLVGGGCSWESCSGGIRNSAEKGISRRANCQVFAQAVFEIHRAPQETVFLLCRYSIHVPCTAKLLNSLSINRQSPSAPALCVLFPAEQNRIPPEQKLLCGKSYSYCKSRAKVHPGGCHFEKIWLKNEF